MTSLTDITRHSDIEIGSALVEENPRITSEGIANTEKIAKSTSKPLQLITVRENLTTISFKLEARGRSVAVHGRTRNPTGFFSPHQTACADKCSNHGPSRIENEDQYFYQDLGNQLKKERTKFVSDLSLSQYFSVPYWRGKRVKKAVNFQNGLDLVLEGYDVLRDLYVLEGSRSRGTRSSAC
ncbi:hypothetical protein RB195_018139 [Necator americanus]|uniref:Uncharacterized protein n=1 Tax=Necator americanus TaxID=51031 RepID=A0ABR1C8E5_NECAM